MADISRELQAIEDAVYGEEVRGSIHDAIDLINKVGEKNISVGTSVTSESSSITGYYKDSVYINTSTDDVWRCNGTKWVLAGNIKGDAGNAGAWVFQTEADWNKFDKNRLTNNDTIIFLWDRTDTGDGGYMSENDYVGSSATKSVHNSDNLEGHNTAFFTGLINQKASATHFHTRADITDFIHTHTKASITDFAHTHAISDITELETTITALQNRLTKLEAIIGKTLAEVDTTATTTTTLALKPFKISEG